MWPCEASFGSLGSCTTVKPTSERLISGARTSIPDSPLGSVTRRQTSMYSVIFSMEMDSYVSTAAMYWSGKYVFR